jgi:hypothetical protein
MHTIQGMIGPETENKVIEVRLILLVEQIEEVDLT